MKKHFTRFDMIIGFALGIVFLGSIICICLANCFTANKATIIGGVLSAFATAVLGMIAFWQNKCYKDLADNYNDIISMPEIFKADSIEDRIKESPLNAFSFYPINGNSGKTINCGSFSTINGPILNLHIETVSCGKLQIVMSPVSHSLLSKESSFSIVLHIPKSDGKYDGIYTMMFVYENIYGIKYKKKAVFGYTANLCHNWGLEKAERYE